MLTQIEIENLRSIKSLKLEDFSRINVFVGPNNVGKSTILEAIFLLLGMSNPQLSMNINNFRDLLLTNTKDLSFNFRNLDFNNTIKISANEDRDGNRTVEISPLYSNERTSKIPDINSTSDIDSNNLVTENDISNDLNGLSLHFNKKNGKIKEYNSKLEIVNNVWNSVIDNNYKENLKARFLNNRNLYGNLVERIDLIQKEKKKEELINNLKVIDDKVIDIALSHTGLVYVDIGIKELIPLNIMGDGFKKACAIISNLLILKDGFLLLDEIENGLHYSTLNLLWKSIIEASKNMNVQVFLTSHSYEAIKVLNNVIEENNYEKDDLRLYSLTKLQGEKHKAYTYKYDNLDASIDSNLEFRGKQLR